jgi:hypothetical protein
MTDGLVILDFTRQFVVPFLQGAAPESTKAPVVTFIRPRTDLRIRDIARRFTPAGSPFPVSAIQGGNASQFPDIVIDIPISSC